MNVSMLQPFIRLIGSSKAWVMIAAIAGAIALTFVKNSGVTSKDALDFIKWVVAAYVTAVGVEDAGKKSAGVTNAAPPPPVDPKSE